MSRGNIIPDSGIGERREPSAHFEVSQATANTTLASQQSSQPLKFAPSLSPSPSSLSFLLSSSLSLSLSLSFSIPAHSSSFLLSLPLSASFSTFWFPSTHCHLTPSSTPWMIPSQTCLSFSSPFPFFTDCERVRFL